MADIISLQDRRDAVSRRARAKLQERVNYLAQEIQTTAEAMTGVAWRVHINIDIGFALITKR